MGTNEDVYWWKRGGWVEEYLMQMANWVSFPNHPQIFTVLSSQVFHVDIWIQKQKNTHTRVQDT